MRMHMKISQEWKSTLKESLTIFKFVLMLQKNVHFQRLFWTLAKTLIHLSVKLIANSDEPGNWFLKGWTHTYQRTNPNKGGNGCKSQNLQRFASTPDPQRSAKKASMKCNVSHRIIKGPCPHRSLTDHVCLRGRPHCIG